jgi:hypothetical protein
MATQQPDFHKQTVLFQWALAQFGVSTLELALKVGQNDPFGVVNVGDPGAVADACERHYTVNQWLGLLEVSRQRRKGSSSRSCSLCLPTTANAGIVIPLKTLFHIPMLRSMATKSAGGRYLHRRAMFSGKP